MGLRFKFILVMGFVCVIGTSGIGFTSYKLSEQTAIEEAKSKGQIIFNSIIATRKFFKNHQKPLVHELVAKDRFYPDLMSGFSVTRGIWDNFNRTLTGYNFKQATLDPLYPPNKADPQEVQIIKRFGRNPAMKKAEGLMTKENEQFFYIAYPIKLEAKGCLRCHGDPKNAPQDQIDIYGIKHGYNWKLGDMVSMFVIYVSIDKALKDARKTAIILFGVIGGAMLMAILALGAIMDRSIIQKIESLSERAQELSMGKGINKSLPFHEKDELGSLAHGLDRLRNSLNRLMRRR